MVLEYYVKTGFLANEEALLRPVHAVLADYFEKETNVQFDFEVKSCALARLMGHM